MKVKTWVEFEQEIEVEVSIADVMSSIDSLEEGDRLSMFLDCIGHVHRVLREIPDDKIAEMNPKQRDVIGSALQVQADRYLIAASVNQPERAVE